MLHAGSDALLEPGVYTLEDLRIFGRKQGWCPYFLARHMLAFANVVVYNYQYMLDPKVPRHCMRANTGHPSLLVFCCYSLMAAVQTAAFVTSRCGYAYMLGPDDSCVCFCIVGACTQCVRSCIA